MPYIRAQNRPPIDATMVSLLTLVPALSAGEVNYVITKILLAWGSKSYMEMESVLGRLEAIKLEYYRRVVAPFESDKRNENGEVYP